MDTTKYTFKSIRNFINFSFEIETPKAIKMFVKIYVRKNDPRPGVIIDGSENTKQGGLFIAKSPSCIPFNLRNFLSEEMLQFPRK